MRALILAGLALLRLVGAPSGPAAPGQGKERTCCRGSGACYSAHRARLDFAGAQEACARRGGRLSSAQGRAEVRAVFALLHAAAAADAAGPSWFWLGLVRKPQRCTHADAPLRSFSWDDPAAEPPDAPAGSSSSEDVPAWLKEPSRSCVTQRCAGLQAPAGEEPRAQPWGLVERACSSPGPGYVCKYRYDGACAAPLPPGAGSLDYALPYGLRSPDMDFSPPGTELTLRCPTREARFTCRPAPDGGYHWAGDERGGLCACPSGYWRPGTEECVEEAAGCVGARGAFLCLCAWGARLAADEESCLRAQQREGGGPPLPTSPPGRNGSLAPGPSPAGAANSSAEDASSWLGAASSTHVLVLVTVAVVMLVTLVLAALQAFQVCCRRCPAPGSSSSCDGSAAGGRPEEATRSSSLAPSKAEPAGEAPEPPKPAAEGGLAQAAAADWRENLRP
ncbi:hypothetical protein lerEdw1_004891 [Lerista edwardsae]|nr:hypothetical protein lerEdw1_004891 [Lerista edwardsae]